MLVSILLSLIYLDYKYLPNGNIFQFFLTFVWFFRLLLFIAIPKYIYIINPLNMFDYDAAHANSCYSHGYNHIYNYL
jgi:hypothetical protein